MFGLSTSWRTRKLLDGNALLDAIKETGIKGLEIDYRIQRSTLNNIKSRLQSSEFEVLSVHAICPMPDDVSPQHASAELFDISSDDVDEHNFDVYFCVDHQHQYQRSRKFLDPSLSPKIKALS